MEEDPTEYSPGAVRAVTGTSMQLYRALGPHVVEPA
jgi:hypothetical protein